VMKLSNLCKTQKSKDDDDDERLVSHNIYVAAVLFVYLFIPLYCIFLAGLAVSSPSEAETTTGTHCTYHRGIVSLSGPEDLENT